MGRRPAAVLLAVLAVGSVIGVEGAPAGASTPIAPTAALAPGTSPANLFAGQQNQPGPPVDLTITNNFDNGDSISVALEVGSSPAPNKGTPDQAVSFANAAVSNTSVPSGDTAPTYTLALVSNPADTSADKTAKVADDLVITFSNSAAGNPSDHITMQINALGFNLGPNVAGANNGVPVALAATYSSGSFSEGFNQSPSAPNGQPVIEGYVQRYNVSESPLGIGDPGSGPPATILAPYTVTEARYGTIAPGLHSLATSAGSLTGTARVTATGLTVGPPGSSGGCPSGNGSSSYTASVSGGGYAFCVMAASTSTSGAGTLTITGATLAPPATPGPVSLTLTNVTTGNVYLQPQPAATVIANPRLAGQTADDTAASAARALYGANAMNNGNGGAVILASDAGYQDALAASFLGYSGLPYQTATGSTATMQGPAPMLLTPPTPPSGGESTTAAAAAISQLGASTVYVIGGTFAVSQAVVDQLAQMRAPGGTLQVVRLAGYRSEDTAAKIAELAAGANLSLPATPGAYGRYNSGASESATGPTTNGAVQTAILADADEFQDALAASPLAYGYGIPVLLTPGGAGQHLDPAAAQAISDLKVQQVIVVGGSFAVSDQAVADLIASGVSVLRIAGGSFDQTAAQLALFELNQFTPPASGTAQVVDGLASPADIGTIPGITVGTSRGDAYPDALSSAQILGGAGSAAAPLLLTADPSTLPSGTGALLTTLGTSPKGGLTVYTDSSGDSKVENILGNVVFGGVYAQTPNLVQTELNAVAAG